MVGQPAQLRHSDRCDRHDADTLGPDSGAAKFIYKLIGRLAGASVVPQQGISDYPSGGVQAHHAVLLGRHRNCGHIVEPARLGDRALQRIPPEIRVYLGAVGVWR